MQVAHTFECSITMTTCSSPGPQRRLLDELSTLGIRAVVLAAIWWVIAGGEAWAWGIPAVTLAACLRPGLGRGGGWRWSLTGLLCFIPAFAWYSLRGALEVAILALDPRRQPDPVLMSFPLRMPPGPAWVFMADLINLVPGTLSTRLLPQGVEIHVLVSSTTVDRTLAMLERRVAGLFALRLPHGIPEST